jgi:hypothetical protein
LRLALVMESLFNILAVVLGILALATGMPLLPPLILFFAPVILTFGGVVALLCEGTYPGPFPTWEGGARAYGTVAAGWQEPGRDQ